MATASRFFHVMSKQDLYPGSGFRMPSDVHAAYIGQLLLAHRGADEVVVAFQGGEPTLMGIEFFRRTLELEANDEGREPRILNTLQTNAALIDHDWAAFLRDELGASFVQFIPVVERAEDAQASDRSVSGL